MKASPENAGPVCAVLLVDKPAGVTSHDVIDRIRRMTGIKKVGHAGTLDPFATGLLLVLVGRATRLSDYFTPLDKEYRVTAQFGAASTTGDSDGIISPVTPAGGGVTESALQAALPGFTGVISQKVPAYSAVKVGGERLYKKARRGEEVEAPSREVEISGLELESFDEAAQQAVLSVRCSKGTYIRQLCEDIGAALGTAAFALELRRTGTGDFSVSRAAGLEELASMPAETLLSETNPSFISGLVALYFLPVKEVDEMEARAIASGRPVEGEATGPVRMARDGRLMAIYAPGDNPGQLRPRVVIS